MTTNKTSIDDIVNNINYRKDTSFNEFDTNDTDYTGSQIKTHHDLIHSVINELDDYRFNNRYYSSDYNKAKYELLYDNIISDVSTNLVDQMTDLSHNVQYLAPRFQNVVNQEKNQSLMNNTIKESKDTLVKRNRRLLDGVNENNRMTEINTYYIKRYRAQNNLLYFIIKLNVFIILLTLINNSYSTILPDLIYAAIVGLTAAYGFITLCWRLYDIYVRNDRNFDEYDQHKFSKTSLNDTPSFIDRDDYDLSKCKTLNDTVKLFNS